MPRLRIIFTSVTDDGELIENIANGHRREDLLNEFTLSILSADACVGAGYDYETVENLVVGSMCIQHVNYAHTGTRNGNILYEDVLNWLNIRYVPWNAYSDT